MNQRGGIKAWLDLMRLSNLPTVWSNTLHGLVAGYVVAITSSYGEQPPLSSRNLFFLLDQAFVLFVAMSMVYSGGMILNDVCDAKVDAVERPGRPIPAGRVSRATAGIVAAVMLLGGVALTLVYQSAMVPVLAGALVMCVVGYDLLHGFRLVGFALMPMCRALVLLTAAMAFPIGVGGGAWVSHVAAPAAALALWTAIVTLVAWGEAARPGRPRLVGWMIAAMPLVDAGFLAWLGAWQAVGFCCGCAGLTLIGQRWVKGS